MTAAAALSGVIPSDTAGAIPSRSAPDLVQALIHNAETKARQGYHNLLVILDVDSAYPSVQPHLLKEVLLDQGWPLNICETAMAFCVGRCFSFRWAQSVFRLDTGLPQGSPWSPILFILYSLPIIILHNTDRHSRIWTTTHNYLGVRTQHNQLTMPLTGFTCCGREQTGSGSG